MKVTYADVDVTNGAAERGVFDLVKVSYAALPWLMDQYELLPCGGALGRGCGPLVLVRDPAQTPSLAGRRVAVPGDRTTAYLLMRLWAAREPPAKVVVVPFHEIMPAIAANAAQRPYVNPFVHPTEIPESRAASSFPPIA